MSQPLPSASRERTACRTRAARGRRILVGGPEPRAVGREHFVDQDDFAVDLAEFEFRVGDDDAALQGVFRARAGKFDAPRAAVPRSIRCRPPSTICSKVMFSSWPDLRFRGGRENRLRQPVAFFRSVGQPDAAHGAALAILGPARARKIAADRRTRSARPRFCGRASSGLPMAGSRSASGKRHLPHVDRDQVVRPSSRSNQKAEICVSTRPLSGMPVGKTQSKALRRSVLDQQQLLAQIVNVADLPAAHGQSGKRCLKNYGRWHNGRSIPHAPPIGGVVIEMSPTLVYTRNNARVR